MKKVSKREVFSWMTLCAEDHKDPDELAIETCQDMDLFEKGEVPTWLFEMADVVMDLED